MSSGFTSHLVFSCLPALEVSFDSPVSLLEEHYVFSRPRRRKITASSLIFADKNYVFTYSKLFSAASQTLKKNFVKKLEGLSFF